MSNKNKQIVSLNNFVDVSDKKLKTGIFVLDLLLGGGIPLWKFSIFYGKESSGKTTIALKILNNFLQAYPELKAIYVDTEKTFDKQWANNFVTNFDNAFIAQPDYGEEAVDICVETFKQADFGLLIVDSLAQLIPVSDADKSAMEDTFASIPKLANKLLRKLLPILGYKQKQSIPSAIVILNQLTTNTNARGFQTPYKKPAGMLQNFVATVDVQCYAKDYKEVQGIPAVVTHQFTIQKAKTTGAVAKRSGEYKMVLVPHDGYKTGDIIDDDVIISYGRKLGIIKQDAGWDVFGVKLKNLQELLEYVKQNKDVRKKLEDEIFKQCKNDLWKTV